MNQYNWEDHIRRTLHDHPSAVDGEALWQAIAPQLGRRRRKWMFFFYFSLALVLTGLAWLGLPQGAGQGRESAETMAPAMPEQSDEDKTAEKILTVPADPVLPARAQTMKDRDISSSRPPAIESQTRARAADLLPRASAGQSRPVSPKAFDILSSPSAAAAAAVDQYAIRESSPLIADGEETVRTFSPATAIPERLPLRTAISLGSAGPPASLPEPISESLIPPPLPAPGRPSWQPFLRLDGGLSRIFRTLQAADTSDYAYRDMRNTTEKPLEAISVSLNGGLEHRSGLFFRFGGQLTRIAERFEYRTTTEIVETDPDGIREIIIGPGGDTTFVTGPVDRIQRIDYFRRSYNDLYLLDIPLIAGYKIGNAPWFLAVEGGAILNLALEGKGTILGPDQKPADLAGGEEILRTSVGLSYHFGLGMAFQLTPQIQTSLSAAFRIFPQSFTREEYALRQKYNLVGLRLGLQYYF